MAWLFVPGLEDSSSESPSPSETGIEVCVSLSGTLSPRRLSWQGWKRRSWIRHLYGTISRRFVANRGADSWISSLRDTRASRSASQESAAAERILATCGRMSRGSSPTSNPDLFSSRTLSAICPSGLTRYPRHFKAWATASLREYSARRRWVLRIDASDCSSWPTPLEDNANNAGSRASNPNAFQDLTVAAATWPTATAGCPEATATTRHGRQNPTLMDASEQWHTPNAAGFASKRQEGAAEREPLLGGQAILWKTPTVQDSDKATKRTRADHQNNLTADVASWATPTARDWKGDYTDEALIRKDGKDRTLDALPTMASRFGPQAQPETGQESPPDSGRQLWPTATAGADSGSRNTEGSRAHAGTSLADAATTGSSASGRSGNRLRLNPEFVEWLMGLPPGWTGSGVSATEWSRWLRLMRSWLWRES